MKVAGLPEPRTNHAEVMARFGDEILKKLRLIAAELGTKLGPGTSSLQMRIGVSLFMHDIKGQLLVFISCYIFTSVDKQWTNNRRCA
jgi:hypothetical protein